MIRLEQTADGWTIEVTGAAGASYVLDGKGGPILRTCIEVTGEHSVAVVADAPPRRSAGEAPFVMATLCDSLGNVHGPDVVERAVAAERARCLAWVRHVFANQAIRVGGPLWNEVCSGIRDGTEAPKV